MQTLRSQSFLDLVARWRPIGGLFLARVAGALLMGGTLAVAARSQDQDVVGRQLTALAVTTVIIAIGDAGLTASLTRGLASSSIDVGGARRIVGLRMALAGASAALWLPIGVIWNLPLASTAAFILLESLVTFSAALFLGTHRSSAYTLVLVSERAVSFALIWLTRSTDDGLILSMAGGAAAALGFAWLLLGRMAAPRAAALRTFVAPLRASWHFAVSSVMSQATNLDTVVVSAVAGPAAAATYGLPSRLTNPLGLLAVSVSQLLLPRAARTHEDRDKHGSQNVDRDLAYSMFLIASVLFPLVLAAPLIVPLLFGDAYDDAIRPFQLVVLAVVFGSANGLMSAVLQGRGKVHLLSRLSVIAIPLGLGGIALGAGIGGPAGAALGLLLLQVVLSASLGAIYLGTRHESRHHWRYKR
jgi:O-antigen/teichoic acid export membrane protein